MKRRTVATVAAACLLATGCSDTGESGQSTSETGQTATSAVADGANPWELPIDQRPALFDPCTEIPESALSEAGFAPEQLDAAVVKHRPGELMACKWDNEELMLSVVSSWKSRADTIADQSLTHAGDVDVAGRSGFLMRPADGENSDTLRGFFHTDRGAVVVSLGFNTGLHTFRGEHLTDIRVAFDSTTPPIVTHLPRGDHQ